MIYIKKPSFTTTIDKDLQEKFKSKCALESLKMNEVLEACMKRFVDGIMEYDSKNDKLKVKEK